jgi:RNA polymerase sigma factor (sigma-70 family)
MPNAKGGSLQPFTGEELFERVMPLLEPAVRAACFRCNYRPAPDDVARFSQRLSLYLIEDNYRRLNTYHEEAQLRTWLQKVANRAISHWLKKERQNLSLEDAPAHTFDLKPEQEEQLLQKELDHLRAEALHHLAPREWELFGLIRQGLKAEEIAQQMNVKRDTVYWMKQKLKKKLEGLLNGEGGGGQKIIF